MAEEREREEEEGRGREDGVVVVGMGVGMGISNAPGAVSAIWGLPPALLTLPPLTLTLPYLACLPTRAALFALLALALTPALNGWIKCGRAGVCGLSRSQFWSWSWRKERTEDCRVGHLHACAWRGTSSPFLQQRSINQYLIGIG